MAATGSSCCRRVSGGAPHCSRSHTRRVTWRTKVGGAPAVEHASREAADLHVEELRTRFRSGATRVALVRLYGPDGGVRLIDFAAEMKDSSRSLRDLERATAARDRAVAEATARWEAAIRLAVELGQTVEDVAAAAGTTVREVRAVLRRD